MKKAILLSIVLAGTLFSVKPQSYPKAPGAIRLLTYNTHYCKGGYDPGEINESNVKKLAQVIKALDADVIALQELDSASQSRGKPLSAARNSQTYRNRIYRCVCQCGSLRQEGKHRLRRIG